MLPTARTALHLTLSLSCVALVAAISMVDSSMSENWSMKALSPFSLLNSNYLSQEQVVSPCGLSCRVLSLPSCHVFSLVMSSLLSCLLSHHVFSPVMSSPLSCLLSHNVFPPVMPSLPPCLPSCHVFPPVMSSPLSCLLSHRVSPFVMSSLLSTTPTIMYLIECTFGGIHAPCIYLHAMYVVVTVYNSGPCHWYLDAYTYIP